MNISKFKRIVKKYSPIRNLLTAYVIIWVNYALICYAFGKFDFGDYCLTIYKSIPLPIMISMVQKYYS